MKKLAILLSGLAVIACGTANKSKQPDSTRLPALKISENGRYFMNEDGSPFFWLGDTGWLLPNKMTREDGAEYLKVRGEQGFNVIQVMVLHNVANVNVYGDTALMNRDVARPITTEGNDPADSLQYDYWDHLDYFIDQAGKNGLYMALVPVWGSNVGSGHVNQQQAKVYGEWIANRYKDLSNIIWLNGGDIQGKDSIEVWQTLGEAIRHTDPNHLTTYHPRGRTTSSMWFHDEQWLDFNMFQSGHRSYAQGQNADEREYGEDNWKYIQEDYAKTPAKPTLDGEPSYENIPIGLHDCDNGYWKPADIRRYAYWSVFAGGAGFTYGESSIMQMLQQWELDRRTDRKALYGAWMAWDKAVYSEGAAPMHIIKDLMLS
ncbi:MAG: DUF4038 domain-containing protein, partial [Rikenellaceae bacterium]|nr:DUF4038 domain-containing protein [Rikenellaceae bacterium]